MKLNGPKLIELRHKRGKLQQSVADETGLDVTTLVRAENGREIQVGTGNTLCDYYGVNIADLVVPAEESNGDAVA